MPVFKYIYSDLLQLRQFLESKAQHNVMENDIAGGNTTQAIDIWLMANWPEFF